MKISYRGFEIEVTRERALGGWASTYYSVFRESDGLEVTSGFSGGDDGVHWWVANLKKRVDRILDEGDPDEYLAEVVNLDVTRGNGEEGGGTAFSERSR